MGELMTKRVTKKALEEQSQDRFVTAMARWVQNTVSTARSAIASRGGRMYDGLRDMWKILGYKTDLKYEDYLAMYERQDVAGRIVDMPAQETWRNPPKLIAKKDDADSTFFDEFIELSERLDLWAWMEQADRLSGIGRFGVMFIGVGTGGDLKNEVKPESLKPEDIIYLAAYDEGRVEILSLDMDTSSPRFGLPNQYKIKLAEFTDPKGVRQANTPEKGSGLVEEIVHWSRIIHIAENPLSDRVYGRPRLQRVFNRMWDMLKVGGGSAEMFWQNVAQIFHINLDPELEYATDDLQNLDAKMLEMLQGVRRIVQTEGIEEIKPLQGKTPDPRGVFSVLKTLIASAAEIPQRILFGSEQGEMASTQDKSEWYGRITSRRQRHAEPNILISFVMRLASWGVLTLPEGGVKADWPSLFEETPTEKASVGRAMAMAASKMSSDRPDTVIGTAEIREAVGLPRRIPADVQADIDIENKKREEQAEIDEANRKEEMEAIAQGGAVVANANKPPTSLRVVRNSDGQVEELVS